MYTNIFSRGDYLYLRSVEVGKYKSHKIPYRPKLWISTAKDTSEEWTTLDGRKVYPFFPGSIKETKDFLERYTDIHGFDVYASPGHEYQYLAEEYPESIDWDIDKIKVFTIDIECETESGFPEPAHAAERILLITIKDTNHKKVVTFGLHPFTSTRSDVNYIHCRTEESLLKTFLTFWQKNYPDVVTGWNTSLFDLPYLYNRICNVLDDSYAKKLSPWNFVYTREQKIGLKSYVKCHILGISSLDYLELYKKFTYTNQESYTLNHISHIELNESKKVNPGSSFKEFYTHYWNDFVLYNIHDVELVDKLDDKMKLLALVFTVAYKAKVNYEDVFSPVKTWDIIIYNYLNTNKMVIPRKTENIKNSNYEGAYVKEPLIGKHDWVVSFDLDSLYPHLILQYNMSTETITKTHLNITVDKLLNKECNLDEAKDLDLAVAANGWCFKKDKKGIFPQLMELYYTERVAYKNQMIEVKKEYEKTNDPTLRKEISRLNNLQMAVKILLNSAYGAIGNKYFRYYDVRIAEAITISGQLAIRWVANRLNKFIDSVLKTTDVDRIVLIDTDSVVLSLDDLIKRVCVDKSTEEKIQYLDKVSEQIIIPEIKKIYSELAEYTNAYEQKMRMKRENIADSMINISKKNYVMSVHNSEGVQYKTPKMKIMGLQMVKSSTPSAVKSKLKDSLKIILHGKESAIQSYISDYRSEFVKLSPEEIAFPRGISDVEKFKDSKSIYTKSTPIHVRGALLYNHYVTQKKLKSKYRMIEESDKIKFVYLKVPNPIHEDCISFIDKIPPEFGLEQYVDYDKMFEKVFEDSIKNIITVLGWTTKQQATLADWFS